MRPRPAPPAMERPIWPRPMSSASEEELRRVREYGPVVYGSCQLADGFARRALFLDIVILGASIWLVAVAFVEPKLGAKLTPFAWDQQIWLGVLATTTFFLTVLQIKTDWKARSDAHRRTLELYAEVKREAGYAIASESIDNASSGEFFLGMTWRPPWG